VLSIAEYEALEERWIATPGAMTFDEFREQHEAAQRPGALVPIDAALLNRRFTVANIPEGGFESACVGMLGALGGPIAGAISGYLAGARAQMQIADKSEMYRQRQRELAHVWSKLSAGARADIENWGLLPGDRFD
jgi:GAF domain-containing protein